MFELFNELDSKNLEERNQYLDKVISNFYNIKELGITEIYIKLLKGDFHEVIHLDGYPKGISKLLPLFGYLHYKEENFFTDGKIEDSYNVDQVDVDIEHPSFVIKNGRKIGYDYAFGEDFDRNYFKITIYNLDFDGSKLPSKEELENTKSDLGTYDYMMKVKKVEQLKEQLKKLASKLNNTVSLLDGYGLNDDDFREFFSEKENILLDAAKETGKILKKKK